MGSARRFELDLAEIEQVVRLVVDEQDPPADADGERAHVRPPNGHPAEPNTIVRMAARSGVEGRQQDLARAPGGQLDARRRPQEIEQSARGGDPDVAHPLEWKPGIAVADDGLEKGGREVVRVAEGAERPPCAATADERPLQLGAIDRRDGLRPLLLAEPGERLEMERRVRRRVAEEIGRLRFLVNEAATRLGGERSAVATELERDRRAALRDRVVLHRGTDEISREAEELEEQRPSLDIGRTDLHPSRHLLDRTRQVPASEEVFRGHRLSDPPHRSRTGGAPSDLASLGSPWRTEGDARRGLRGLGRRRPCEEAVMSRVSIRKELAATFTEPFRKLASRTAQLERVDASTFGGLDVIGEMKRGATPRVAAVLDEMLDRQDELYALLSSEFARLRTQGEDVRRARYAGYLVQLWYHTSFHAEFSRCFGEKLAHHLEGDPFGLGPGKKLLRQLFTACDEEAGRELWALQDLDRLGAMQTIDLRRDVLPETRALVRAQFDRLERLNFKGFLGYSLYLASWVSGRSADLLALMESARIPVEATAFARNHPLVERSRALGDVEIANLLILDDHEAEEVLDHMEIVHCLHSGMAARSLRP